MAPDQGTIEFVAAKDQPTKSAEQPSKPLDAKSIGRNIEAEFKSDKEKAIFGTEFMKIIKDKFSQFSEKFQKNFIDANGQPDPKKLLGLYGVSESFSEKYTRQDAAKIADSIGVLDLNNNTIDKSGPLPERPSNAPTGSQFMAAMDRLGNMNDKDNQHKMEEYILAEISRGNIPSFCRPERMKTITMSGPDGTKVSFKTSLDYMAIGSDEDYIRVPMTPLLAQAIAKKYNLAMPTKEMAKAIYDKADVKIEPGGLVRALHAKEDQLKMQGNDFIRAHNARIAKLLGPEGLKKLQQGQILVAGHQKDPILSSYAEKNPKRLDFFGYYVNGKPVQDNPAHEDDYRDYSHGTRFSDGTITVRNSDGSTKEIALYDALKDPKYASILNGNDGPLNPNKIYTNGKFNNQV
ncbi:hypothetical protein IT412_01460 [Candidatus Peregrinibacteria bacterium]|nr:hypothetical protein [Candidatus Peregrinibacteria bacterium]